FPKQTRNKRCRQNNQLSSRQVTSNKRAGSETLPSASTSCTPLAGPTTCNGSRSGGSGRTTTGSTSSSARGPTRLASPTAISWSRTATGTSPRPRPRSPGGINRRPGDPFAALASAALGLRPGLAKGPLMGKRVEIENIEERRREVGIDDVVLREDIRGLAIGDLVKLTLLTDTASFAG